MNDQLPDPPEVIYVPDLGEAMAQALKAVFKEIGEETWDVL